ncbi:glycosidase [Edaphobacter lichenicola]|uniref:Glycosidase n=1 Tax=Tunturiibacter gelidiferens TaxID=3069689 RepID=A0A9X0U7N4_9BACT|nr:glycosidase [Edaphobacter lichenicola]
MGNRLLHTLCVLSRSLHGFGQSPLGNRPQMPKLVSRTVHTWLPIPLSSRTTNVEAVEHDPNSLLNWHRSLITLQRSNPSLCDGHMVFLNPEGPNVLSFVKCAFRRETDTGRNET